MSERLRLRRVWQDEHGITALETAIILIAFVVVAAVFAFTVLSAGTFLTEQSKQAAYAGLDQVMGSIELKGSVVISGTVDGVVPCAISETVSGTAKSIYFNVSSVAGGRSIDLTSEPGEQVVRLQYRDRFQQVDLNRQAPTTGTVTPYWRVEWIGQHDGDNILDSGELARIVVNLQTGENGPLTCALWKNQTFTIEVIPPHGGVYVIERTTPASIDPITDLY